MATANDRHKTRKQVLEDSIVDFLTDVFETSAAADRLRETIPHLGGADQSTIKGLLANFKKGAHKSLRDAMPEWLAENNLQASFEKLDITSSFSETIAQSGAPPTSEAAYVVPDADMPTRVFNQVQTTNQEHTKNRLQKTLAQRKATSRALRQQVEGNIHDAKVLCQRINTVHLQAGGMQTPPNESP